ncbi:MAG: AbrB/MazE/SpoVT family DNA-binding domain-containing protein [Ruminococcus sp.]|nr:AbrB/MazE/SpoVT family DNA-binding domain-containing protein [Ruminococcus sp.]
MIFTNFREIDKAGRIVISKDIRKHLNIHPGDILHINADDNSVIIKKAEPSCVFCNTIENLITFGDKQVCRSCARKLAEDSSIYTE